MESLIELYIFVTGILLIVFISRFLRTEKSKREKIINIGQYLVCYHLVWFYVFAVQYYMEQ
jgi:choline-glycine betaine transporter